jgi:HSP20 family protein
MLFFKNQKNNTDEQFDTLNALISLPSSTEGRLAIDVYKLGNALVVRSTIAGANIDDLDLSIDGDILSIKGKRSEPDDIDYLDYLYRECYWGNFSRSILLPFLVDEEGIEADLDNGILTIVLPIKAS